MRSAHPSWSCSPRGVSISSSCVPGFAGEFSAARRHVLDVRVGTAAFVAGTPVAIVVADSYSYVSAPAGISGIPFRASISSDAGSYLDEYTALQEIGIARSEGSLHVRAHVSLFLVTLPLSIALALALVVAAFCAGGTAILSAQNTHQSVLKQESFLFLGKQGLDDVFYVVPVRASRELFHDRTGELAHSGSVGNTEFFFFGPCNLFDLFARGCLWQVGFDDLEFRKFFFGEVFATAFFIYFRGFLALLAETFEDGNVASLSAISSVGFLPLATSSLVNAAIAPRNVCTRRSSFARIAFFMSSRMVSGQHGKSIACGKIAGWKS